MTEQAAFTNTICERTAHGLDTTAERLVFADWLEEHGQGERAEFIRVQCELARHREVCDQPGFLMQKGLPEGFILFSKREALRRREQELLGDSNETDANYHRWASEASDLFDILGLLSYEYRRGFIGKVRCSFRDWCGEICERCSGQTGQYLYQADDPLNKLGHGSLWYECSNCHGTGRVNAFGPQIVRAAPVEEFEATDSQPIHLWFPWMGRARPAGFGTVTRPENNAAALQWARELAFGKLASKPASTTGP